MNISARVSSKREDVSAPLLSLVVARLMDAWRPNVPTFANVVRFVWANQDLSTHVRSLTVAKDVLQVRGDDAELLSRFINSDERTAFRNQPLSGELEDGSTFEAESAFLDVDYASAHYWIWSHHERPAKLWVAIVHGLESLSEAGNTVTTRKSIMSDGSTLSSSRSHHRFEGAYVYYLIDASPDGDRITSPRDWVLIIDTRGAGPPTRDLVYPDMLALQFSIGRAFYFELALGLDDDLKTVAIVGGSHGRDHGSRGQQHAPVPFTFQQEHWPSLLFEKISSTYRTRSELRLYVALSHYLDALASFNVENKYLVLHVALEALAYWLLGGDKGAEQAIIDKPKWKAWLQERKAEIMSLAVDGQGPALFNKITSVPKRRATSRVVEDAFAATNINLKLSEEMAAELDDEGRGLIVHTAMMFKESQSDVDAYLKRIALVRSMLVALVARIVGYQGAIVGWERQPYDEPDPDWWPVHDDARRAARRQYTIKL